MMRTAHLRRAAVGLAVLAVAVTACSTSHHASAGQGGPSTPASTQSTQPAAGASDATVVTKFNPYSATGALTVAVTDRAVGECWTSSIVVQVANAYRCLVGNDISDPCFDPPRHTVPATVACVSSPWSSARVVTLTKALPEPSTIGKATNPWAVQLANGARCVAASGTVQSVGGVSLNLLCPGGTAAGGLDDRHHKWTVKYGTAEAGSLVQVAVVAAWRG